MAPSASAKTASSGGNSVHIAGYGRCGGCRSPFGHTLTSLTCRQHIIGGMNSGTSLHYQRRPRAPAVERAPRLSRGPRIYERGTILRDCDERPLSRRRWAGAVTGATFASARSHPMTRQTLDARKRSATKLATRWTRALGVSGDCVLIVNSLIHIFYVYDIWHAQRLLTLDLLDVLN